MKRAALRPTSQNSHTRFHASGHLSRPSSSLASCPSWTRSDGMKVRAKRVDETGYTIARATRDDLNALVPLFDAYRVFYRQPSDPERARSFLGERLENL